MCRPDQSRGERASAQITGHLLPFAELSSADRALLATGQGQHSDVVRPLHLQQICPFGSQSYPWRARAWKIHDFRPALIVG
ncbi:MAG: hypothetical protein BGO96_05305 [Micrococcales bacterium 73-15]|nr:MAG: hypothetical protein BGO96_05305 [Micrococcales bacterium 73-15]